VGALCQHGVVVCQQGFEHERCRGQLLGIAAHIAGGFDLVCPGDQLVRIDLRVARLGHGLGRQAHLGSDGQGLGRYGLAQLAAVKALIAFSQDQRMDGHFEHVLPVQVLNESC
jgi:hypothetical protein